MSQTNVIQKIVIVGGGTAGWLAANHLAKNLITNSVNSIEITLVESANIPTIGVGEGTVPMMRQSLQHLGISETEFILECDATFKQGIKFVDWTTNPVAGKPAYYHHIFDYPKTSELDLTAYWLKNMKGSGISYVDALSIQGKICDAGLAPKMITTPEFQGATSYGYHLDANKFSALLAKNAVKKLGVTHIQADVVSVLQHENGEISSLVIANGENIQGDFFVDCTGFKSLLLGEKLKVPFKDKSGTLFVDHAVAIQVPYEQADAPIASHTISTALTSGWVWDIGLKERRGIGHVYSSSHTSHEQAEQDLRAYIGPISDGVDSRLIPMKIGYREKFWHKNCVALGLSQGFVEPLEATGLLVFDATAKMLAEQFPSSKLDMPLIAKQFNERVALSWDNVIDFVKAHYCLSKRDDSQFWLDNRANDSIPDSLQERLERWKYQPPSPYDFSNKFGVFNLENYQYILYGMDFDTNLTHFQHRLSQDELASKVFADISNHSDLALNKLPKHRELIDKIYQYGLQKI
ncbi:tryptophan 7-halogenase [Colwellia sp. 75C3]|uniref:tryptophan halogenase family protein n=1 Tax=Colwellia sp. 75C3 TaxID=888425 RepID=UPI000C32B097|nr:tryptophan halogenase family protein [Colwellia sp. 75C3]PKG86274.1 tryptophan 7-halogenase [Colwellia sp. 75C3]